MLASFRDGWREARAAGTWSTLCLVHLLIVDLLRTALHEWVPGWRNRPQMTLGHHSGRLSHMETLWTDLRHAVRSLRASPLGTSVAALTIAIGVGATTTVLSVANAFLLRPPPGITAARELVTVHEVSPDGSSFHSFSYPAFEHLRAAGGGLQDLAAWTTVLTAFATDDDPVALAGMGVSPNYFSVLGSRPFLGRLFVEDDEAGPGGPRVVVLSHGTWTRRLAANPDIIGQAVILNGEPHTVVGVAEEGFQGHISGVDVALWLPVSLSVRTEEIDAMSNPRTNWLELVGRLAPGATAAQASGMLTPALGRYLTETGLPGDRGVDVRDWAPVPAPVLLPVAGFLGMLLVLAGLILMIASANVANILLVRAMARSREIAVRLALGATRARLVRQLATESVVLFAIGGVGGALIATWAAGVLSTIHPPVPIPLALDFSPDARVFLATLVVILSTGFLFGLAPALRSTRPDLTRSLKDEPGVILMGRFRIRGTFVVAQVAGTTLLLVVAGLFIRTLGRAGEVDLGFDLAGLHVLTVETGSHGYTAAATLTLAEELERRVAALPGMELVGTTDFLPLNLGNRGTVFAIPDREQVEGVGRFRTDYTSITPGYLGTMGIPVLRGRGFSSSDREGAPLVMIINETLARLAWPNEDPVGKVVTFGSVTDGIPIEIIGVARDAKYRSLGDQDIPMTYIPLAQEAPRALALLVRPRPGSPPPGPSLRAVLRDLAPALPASANSPYRDVVGVSLLPNRIASLVATIFGATGLLLATVGLYGVLAFSVQTRRREIGVRMALGAADQNVRRLVLRDGLRLTVIGLGLGLVFAAILGRLLTGLLYGLSPLDPVTYGVIIGVMLGTGWIAALGPIRRALRTEPLEVLRHG